MSKLVSNMDKEIKKTESAVEPPKVRSFVIVEDDPMVCKINSQYLQRLGSYQEVGTFANGYSALDFLKEHPVDLAIVDIYMPVMDGLELVKQMRANNIKTAVIMVTAATDMATIEQLLHLGIVDYLIKPFSFQRFQEAVKKYETKAELLRSTSNADQTTVDRLLRGSWGREQGKFSLGKGLNQKTMETIEARIKENPTDKHTCESLSAATGLSKVTVRHYLNYLLEMGQIQSSIDYETGGRPRVLYHLR